MSKIGLYCSNLYIVFFILFILIFAQWHKAISEEHLLNRVLRFVLIIPPVFFIGALISVWIEDEKIRKLVGNKSIKTIFFSIISGSIPSGPIYMAFPIARAMLDKGARILNISLFISAWASLKIPQIILCIYFFGYRFAIYFYGLMIICIISSSIAVEAIIFKNEEHPVREIT